MVGSKLSKRHPQKFYYLSNLNFNFLRSISCAYLVIFFFTTDVIAQGVNESASILRTIQALENLRYEIQEESLRFKRAPKPTSNDSQKTWYAIKEDFEKTLKEIDKAISVHRKLYSGLINLESLPLESSMPPLLPE